MGRHRPPHRNRASSHIALMLLLSAKCPRHAGVAHCAGGITIITLYAGVIVVRWSPKSRWHCSFLRRCCHHRAGVTTLVGGVGVDPCMWSTPAVVLFPSFEVVKKQLYYYG